MNLKVRAFYVANFKQRNRRVIKIKLYPLAFMKPTRPGIRRFHFHPTQEFVGLGSKFNLKYQIFFNYNI
jgi:hypothetical protein